MAHVDDKDSLVMRVEPATFSRTESLSIVAGQQNADETKVIMAERGTDCGDHKLSGGMVTRHRAVAALVTRSARHESSQRCGFAVPLRIHPVMERLERVGCLLSGKQLVQCLFHWQQGADVQAYWDADWCGDTETRGSASARVLVRGEHCTKT